MPSWEVQLTVCICQGVPSSDEKLPALPESAARVARLDACNQSGGLVTGGGWTGSINTTGLEHGGAEPVRAAVLAGAERVQVRACRSGPESVRARRSGAERDAGAVFLADEMQVPVRVPRLSGAGCS